MPMVWMITGHVHIKNMFDNSFVNIKNIQITSFNICFGPSPSYGNYQSIV